MKSFINVIKKLAFMFTSIFQVHIEKGYWLSYPLDNILDVFSKVADHVQLLKYNLLRKGDLKKMKTLSNLKSMGQLQMVLEGSDNGMYGPLVLPAFISNILPILNKSLILLKDQALPIIHTLANQILTSFVELTHHLTQDFNGESELCSDIQVWENVIHNYHLSILESWTTLIMIYGAVIEIEEHTYNCLSIYIIDFMRHNMNNKSSALSNNIHSSEAEEKRAHKIRSLKTAMEFNEIIFRHLNCTFKYNYALLKKLRQFLIERTIQNYFHQICTSPRLVVQFLNCLYLFIQNSPYISTRDVENTANILTEFSKEPSTLEVKEHVSTILQRLDLLTHPKIPFLPHFCLENEHCGLENEIELTQNLDDFVNLEPISHVNNKISSSDNSKIIEETPNNNYQIESKNETIVEIINISDDDIEEISLHEKELVSQNENRQKTSCLQIEINSDVVQVENVEENNCETSLIPVENHIKISNDLQNIMDMLVPESSSSEDDG